MTKLNKLFYSNFVILQPACKKDLKVQTSEMYWRTRLTSRHISCTARMNFKTRRRWSVMSWEWGKAIHILSCWNSRGRSVGLYARENVSNRPSVNASVRRVRDRRQANGADRI